MNPASDSAPAVSTPQVSAQSSQPAKNGLSGDPDAGANLGYRATAGPIEMEGCAGGVMGLRRIPTLAKNARAGQL